MEDQDEPIEIPIEDVLDLHPFSPIETREVALAYLIEARRIGFREVRLIHGRGIGVQREIIRSLLASLTWVESFADADPAGGGWGRPSHSSPGPAKTPRLSDQIRQARL